MLLEHTSGTPIQMFVSCRRYKNESYGQCAGEREYFVNRPMKRSEGSIVGFAYVVCKQNSTVYLRNTDQMMFLPDYSANKQIYLARRVGGSLVSIKPRPGYTLPEQGR